MDNADIGEPTGNVECPQTCSAFQNCGPSIRCNAPDRINDGYFNGLLEELMATATKKAPAAKKATVSAKKAPTPVAKKPTVSAKKAVSPATKTANATPLKPIKDSFTKASLSLHLAERAGVEPKAAKALMAALEETVLASVHKKGAKEFTLPGLLKVVAQDVPAKKKRFGKDPFSGEDKWFAAKPASVRLKVRPLKKLKDAAL